MFVFGKFTSSWESCQGTVHVMFSKTGITQLRGANSNAKWPACCVMVAIKEALNEWIRIRPSSLCRLWHLFWLKLSWPPGSWPHMFIATSLLLRCYSWTNAVTGTFRFHHAGCWLALSRAKKIDHPNDHSFHIPDAQCMVYLPMFTINLGQM